jgi:hypothetical protein
MPGVTPATRRLRLLSLGAGVQSSTLLLLSIRGELPPLDAAIFADTKYEPEAVYAHLAWLEELARVAGVPIYRVSGGNLRRDTLENQVPGVVGKDRRWASMPFFLDGGAGDDPGMVRRQCTDEYKLRPIRKQVRALAGLAPGERAGDRVHVEQWVGMSADELSRVRVSPDYWIDLRYPLIFDLRPAWTRADCHAWLQREYPTHPVPRSACISCPFHSNAEWRRMRDCDPVSWREAVAFDRAIRKLGGMRADAYLHPSLRPLDEAPIDDVDPRQGTLFSCGVCGT